MENASKALIMAGEILLGVMIISIGVYLFNTIADYSASTTAQITEAQIAKFNAQFLEYYEKEDCTIHDIVSIANLANQNNLNYGFDGVQNYNEESSYYIQVDIKKENEHLEVYSKDNLIKLIKDNSIIIDNSTAGITLTQTKYYKCTQCKVSPKTKRVCYVEFEPK